VRTEYRWGDPRERDHLEDLGIDVKMDLEDLRWGAMEWVELAEDRDR